MTQKINLTKLETENQNTRTMEIDTFSTHEILSVINSEDQKVAPAVEKAIPQIEKLVEAIVDRLSNGGRLFYIGAGTSGRLGFLDAAECPPTYGVSYELVQGIMAGGFEALYKAKEGAEDDAELGVADCKERNLCEKDVLVGLAASGRTPYVLGALRYANSIGAFTGSIACVSDSEIGKVAQVAIEVLPGQEVVTGSTRMKAGTSQKLILNMISTASMIRLGKVYNNLMVDVKPTNIKLVNRAKGIIQKATQCSEETASKAFEEAGQSCKLAIFMILSEMSREESEKILSDYRGHLKEALRAIGK